jgi:penicillin-binding protein 1A
MEAQIYRECVRYYPFVLGAQPVRPIDLAAFYAAIANEGVRPEPHVIDAIEHNGLIVYRHDPKSSVTIGSVDRAAFYQLKSMLQGVLQRGTARSMAGIAPFVAGKTGTSDSENDAWFVGFSNEVTVAVWVGYDNASGKRRTLGGGATGGHTAVPIFEPIMQAVWANVAPRTALAPPSPEARRQLSCRSIDLETGEAHQPGGRPITECFRIDLTGRIVDTQYRLVSRGDAYIYREPRGYDVFPNQFPFFGFPQRLPPGYYDQRRNNGFYHDAPGRYIQSPRDSGQGQGQHGPPQYGQPQPQYRQPQYGQPQSVQPQSVQPQYGQPQAPPQRDPYGREYRPSQRIDPGYLREHRPY